MMLRKPNYKIFNFIIHSFVANWNQIVDCHCCQPTDYRALIIELMCEDYKVLKKKVVVPVSCSCSACNSSYTGRKGGVKG